MATRVYVLECAKAIADRCAPEFRALGVFPFVLNCVENGVGHRVFSNEVTAGELDFACHTTLDSLAAHPSIITGAACRDSG